MFNFQFPNGFSQAKNLIARWEKALNFQFPNGFSQELEAYLKKLGYNDFQFPNGFSHRVASLLRQQENMISFNSLTDSHTQSIHILTLTLSTFNSLTDSHGRPRGRHWRVQRSSTFNSLTDSHSSRSSATPL